ncbi:hypothetical protein [Williamsia sterculiae]|uniref:Uncharacterized protein n=1 Tax=Williamsia sterculiae TaxID=1344003 RepID=A0A1N7FGY9_9NOCA|nr:hypothetical protein [Williamsia sterculiae]SIR99592.1 hypothetical protein SAMN05445060_2062 [Williamsia sterculiae]
MSTSGVAIQPLAAAGGGAALDQVFGMSAAAAVVSAGLLWVGYLHRARKITWLTTLAEWAGRRLNRPPWAALPIFLFVSTIICALFGFLWDVSLHIGKGRDAGPLANPAHYFILVGLFLLFIAGMLSVFLPYDKPGRSAVRITRTWHAPVGGILLSAAGFYALLGFPLDDIWHRIFGQDVTLWGPTHLMLIGGAGLSLIAVVILDREGKAAMGPDAPADKRGNWLVRCLAFGGLLIGLSVFQIEYDFGVEQFRLVLQPMMIAGAASLALVAGRLTLGPGSAILAAVFAIAVRGVVALVVGPVLGAPINVLPLYLGAALVVEVLALTPLVKRRLLFGLVAGLGVSTVGLWIESFWIDAVYHYPWPTSMWGEGLAMAVPVGVATGLCGGLLAVVAVGEKLPRRSVGIGAVLLTVLIIAGAVANGLQTTVPDNTTATIALTQTQTSAGQLGATADVTLRPADVVGDNPEWVTLLAWQGGLDNQRGLVIDRLEKVGPGHYRSTEPVPITGDWKTLLRVQDGYTMAAVPVYLPSDAAIGAAGEPAEPNSTKPLIAEIKVLQRERTFDVPAWLYPAASVVVLVCSLALIAALSWGAGRVNDHEASGAGTTRRRPSSLQPQP